MKSSLFACCALLVSSAAASACSAQNPVSHLTDRHGAGPTTSAKTQIKEVMAEFHEAVASHDGARLSSMFVDQGSTWFNVLSDAAYARARASNRSAPKVRHSSFEEFAKFVSSSHATLNPQHSSVRILTDGTIASAYFNFVFLIDGKPENQGTETWQLVKASDGWKIAAITYSSNPSAAP